MEEVHPIQVNPPLSIEERLTLLENYLAQLWDQVWWMNLSESERDTYLAQGFSAPIGTFYNVG